MDTVNWPSSFEDNEERRNEALAGQPTPLAAWFAFACGAGHCRLAPLFLSNTANIGPSDRMLPWLLSGGAYN
jgi:hypothetical protein